MLIRGNLFSKGYSTHRSGLSDILEHHKRSILDRIRAITDLEQMTDDFLTELVNDALVPPLHLHFDRMTHKPRTEQFHASDLPDLFMEHSGHTYPKTVARIVIPFTGDRQLLEYMPNSASFNLLPRGEVSGQTIQFDVVFWGYGDDNERVSQEIKQNRDNLAFYAGNVNKQVKEFNERLLDEVKPVFQTKLEQLTRQLSVFDSLGIKEEEEPVPVYPVVAPTAPKPKRATSRAVHIIQYIEQQYVEKMTQINKNTGDVNNAIQSS